MMPGRLLFPKRSTDRYKLILLITFINMTVFLGLAWTSYRSLTVSQNRSNEIFLLQKGIFELNTLSQDYLNTSSKRALRQWKAKYSSVHSSVVNLTLVPSDHIDLILRLGRSLGELHKNFDDFQSRNTNNVTTERKLQLANSSRYLAHEISSMILQLSQSANAELRDRQITTWISVLLFVLLSKSIIAVTTVVMWRRSSKSVAALAQGIGDIGEGRVPSVKDEFDEDIDTILRNVNQLGHRIVSEQKSTLDKLRSQTEIAEKASQAKSVFLANVSHEIRTPLSIIDGYTKMLLESEGENRKDYLAKIHWNVKYIVRLVNEILDLSKIEADKMEIQSADFSLTELVPLFESMNQKAKEKGLSFGVQCLKPVPIRIQADQTRIEQILINLIGNAIKYTDSGRVSVKMKFKAPWLVFEVEDTGIGLDQEQANQLFSPFYQVNPTESEGTGLGLAISAKTAELLGGSVYLKRTQVGKGSIFVFEFPVQKFDSTEMISTSAFSTVIIEEGPKSAANPGAGPLFGLKILVAEDNRDLRTISEILLQMSGAKIAFATNGKEAVDLALSADKEFDLILMDIQMPEMDGYAACREIRKVNKDIPIIGCSARVFKEEKSKGIAAGMNAYLEKPLNVDKLVQALDSIEYKRFQTS